MHPRGAGDGTRGNHAVSRQSSGIESRVRSAMKKFASHHRAARVPQRPDYENHRARARESARLRTRGASTLRVRAWTNHGRCIAIYCFRDKSTWNRSRVNTSHFHATFAESPPAPSVVSSSPSWSKYLSDSFNAPAAFFSPLSLHVRRLLIHSAFPRLSYSYREKLLSSGVKLWMQSISSGCKLDSH